MRESEREWERTGVFLFLFFWIVVCKDTATKWTNILLEGRGRGVWTVEGPQLGVKGANNIGEPKSTK